MTASRCAAARRTRRGSRLRSSGSSLAASSLTTVRRLATTTLSRSHACLRVPACVVGCLCCRLPVFGVSMRGIHPSSSALRCASSAREVVASVLSPPAPCPHPHHLTYTHAQARACEREERVSAPGVCLLPFLPVAAAAALSRSLAHASLPSTLYPLLTSPPLWMICRRAPFTSSSGCEEAT